MLKHFDTSSSLINNETKFALYIEVAKPLILSLPDINDRAKALAWFRKIIFDSSILLVRIEYLELLLKFLKRGKLSGPFAGLPDTRQPLQKLNKGTKLQQLTQCDNKINQFTQVSSDDIDNEENNNSSTLRCNHMKVIHHEKNWEDNKQCFNKNKRISAGYSPFTKREMKHQLKMIMNSPGNDHEKIKRCKEILAINCLPPITASDESELNRFVFRKQLSRCKKEKDYEKYNHTFDNVISKDNCNNETNLQYEYPVNKKIFQHVHGKHNKRAETLLPIKEKLNEENHKNTELDYYCGTSKNSKLESFLMGSKKYLTLCVSKDCLVERNILKCVKYIISNAQCKFFKFKEYCNSPEGCSMMKPTNTCDISKKRNENSFVNKRIRRKKRDSYEPEITETSFFNNNSVFMRLRNILINNVTFANTCNFLQNMVGKSIYIKMSIILAAGVIFFWKVYQIIFAYQRKRLGYSTQIVSLISNIRKNTYFSYVYIFVGCFILHEIIKDFISIFCE